MIRLFVLTLALTPSFAGAGLSAACRLALANRVFTVAVLTGGGVNQVSLSGTMKNLARLPDLTVKLVDIQKVRAGALDGVHALIVPGGNLQSYRDVLQRGGADVIRRYIEQGGFYFGTGSGAYMLGEGYFGLGIVHWERASLPGSEYSMIQIEKAAEFLAPAVGPKFAARTGSHPRLVVDKQTRVLAWFRSDSLRDTPAIVDRSVGSGRVVLSNTHPEVTGGAGEVFQQLVVMGLLNDYPIPK